MDLLAAVPVIAAGLYLVTLGLVALLRPVRARRFLAGFASSRTAHLVELGVRLVVGGGLVLWAPRMRFTPLFFAFGWMLIVTSLGLLALPWRWHARFAQWSVPMATQRLPMFAVASLLGGAFILYAAWTGRGGV